MFYPFIHRTLKKKIFYSWQSDLKPNTNRSLILDCLTKAIKSITAQDLEFEAVLDRDTAGVSGSPEVVGTIFSKIDKAHVHVADISIINKGAGGRLTPNPNVLLELGYAAKVLGWDHVITVFNTDTGRIEDLPFDVRARRPLTYSGEKRAEDKKPLQKDLETALKSILDLDTPNETVKKFIKIKLDALFLTTYHNIYRLE